MSPVLPLQGFATRFYLVAPEPTLHSPSVTYEPLMSATALGEGVGMVRIQ